MWLQVRKEENQGQKEKEESKKEEIVGPRLSLPHCLERRPL